MFFYFLKQKSSTICRLAFLFFLFLVLPIFAQQQVYWVSPFGNDGFDGSQATPFATINHALSIIQDLDTIRIEPGIYYEQLDITGLTGVNDFVMQGTSLIDTIAIVSPNQGPAIRINMPFSRQTQFLNLSVSHIHPDTIGSGIEILNATPTINNCAIRGNRNGSPGGGIRILNSVDTTGTDTLLISKCHIYDNEAPGGAGIYVQNSALIIEYSKIEFNRSASDPGAGMFFQDCFDMDIQHNQVHANEGGIGAGIYLDVTNSVGGSNTIINNLIYRNNGLYDGAGMYVYGSGVSNTIFDNTFGENDAQGNGGGLYIESTSNIVLNNNIFVNNNSQQNGGGICFLNMAGSNIDLRSNHVSGNMAAVEGGGLYLLNCDNLTVGGAISLRNNFYHNRAGITQNAISSGSPIASLDLSNNYWGFPEINAVQLQINIPGSNLTGLSFEIQPFSLSIPLVENQTLYYFGDGFIEFQPEAFMLTGSDYLDVSTVIDTVLVPTSGFNFLNKQYIINFTGINPNLPTDIFLYFDQSELDNVGNPPSQELQVAFYDGDLLDWFTQPSFVDDTRQLVMANFSVFPYAEYSIAFNAVETDTVFEVHPEPNRTDVAEDVQIDILFEQQVDESTLTPQSIKIIGQYSGIHTFDQQYDPETLHLRVKPHRPFLPGEEVTVTLSGSILDDTTMPISDGFTWKFHIGAFLGNLQFVPGMVSDYRFDAFQYQLADMTGDYYPDLVELSNSMLSIFTNDQNGNFNLLDTLALTFYDHMAIEDLDRDNHPECVLVNATDITIYEYIYANNEFSLIYQEPISVGAGVVDISLADFNNDGWVDICLLVDNASFYETRVFFADTSSGFSLTAPSTRTLAGYPSKIIQSDINNDGFIDIIANGGSTDSDLTLLINHADSTFNRIFSTPMDIQYFSGIAASNVWSGFPYDMEREIIISGESISTYEPTINVVNLDPDGNLNPLFSQTFLSPLTDLITTDITSDGRMDIVFCDMDSNIQILENIGESFITLPVLIDDVGAAQVFAADLDLDGDMDLLAMERLGSMWRWQILANQTRENRSFYVDYNSPGGNGDMDSPFQRIYEALIRTIDYDTVLINGGGPYQDHLVIDKNLVIKSIGFEPVTLQPLIKSNFDSSVISIENVARLEMDNFYIMLDSLIDGEIAPDYIIGIQGTNVDSLLLRNISVWGLMAGVDIENVNLVLNRIYIRKCGIGIKARNSYLNMRHIDIEDNSIAGMIINASDLILDKGNLANNAFGPTDYEGGLIAENSSSIRMRNFEASINGVANVILRNSSGDFQYGGIFDAFQHTASDPGAGFYAQNATSLNIYNTIIGGNEKYGIYAQNSNLNIQNNILGKNDSLSSTAEGGGIRLEGGNARIVNNILGMNNHGIYTNTASVQVNYNDFIGNTSDSNTDIIGVGNINENPLFVSDYFVFGESYMSSDSGFGLYQFKLAPGSPLIDRGDPALFNEDNSRSDIGMFGSMDSSLALSLTPDPIISVADSLINISWNASDVVLDTLYGATAIFRNTQTGFIPDTSHMIALLLGNVNAFTDRDLEFGKTYFYKLAFVDIHSGVSGYSEEVNGILDFYSFYFGRRQEFTQLGQGDSLQKSLWAYNSGTLPLQVQMQDITTIPSWLTVTPQSVNIAAMDSAEFILKFSAVDMPKDTLLRHTLYFGSPDNVMLRDSIIVRMLVSYRDLFPPQTEMLGTYPDTVRQSLLKFRFLGNDQVYSTIGTPLEMLRYQFSLIRFTSSDTLPVASGITEQTSLIFNPIHDGHYIFKVAAIDTSNRGGLNTISQVGQLVNVYAGPTPSPANVWQMVSPSRRLDQFSAFLSNNEILSIKSWKNEEYIDVAPENVKYGKGYWIITNRNRIYNWDKMEFLKQDTALIVNLQVGWNQIGNPWSWDIKLDRCQFITNDGRVISYNSALDEGTISHELYYNKIFPLRQYKLVSDYKLMPKYGYWIYVNRAVGMQYDSSPDLSDIIDKEPTVKKTKSVKTADILINLKAQSGKYADSENFYGICENIEDYDHVYYPALEPPGMNDYLSLYNVDNNVRWSGQFKEKRSNIEEWDIRLERGIVDNDTKLEWDFIKSSDEMHLFLYHLETGQWFNMNDRKFYSFENKRKVNHFKLYATEDENFEPEVLPIQFALSQNYPNPFNLQTTVELAVPFFADNHKADLIVYDVLGRKVKTLLSGPISSGYHKINWDGRSDAGNVLASGLYIFRFSTKDFRSSKKMILIK